MKKALLMGFSDPRTSPRSKRLLPILGEMGYQVDLLSYPTTEDPPGGGRKYELPRPRPTTLGTVRRKLRAALHMALRRVISHNGVRDWLNDVRMGLRPYHAMLASNDYDLIVVHDLHLLGLARRIQKRAKLVFDAQEFYCRQNDENLWFRLAEKPECERISRVHLRACDEVITVSPSLVKAHDTEFGIRSHLVLNVPWYQEITPSEVTEGRFRMVHLGIANPNRQLEKMIDIVSALDARFTLDFYLTGSEDYIARLKAKAATTGGRVRVLPPVEFDEIITTLNAYDIGLYYLEPIALNLLYSLPNKLFEFIQARLMIAVGPSPDMSRVVREHGCGIVSDSFDPASMVAALSKLTADDVRRAKRNSHAAARVLCFEQEAGKLRQLLSTESDEGSSRGLDEGAEGGHGKPNLRDFTDRERAVGLLSLQLEGLPSILTDVARGAASA